MSHLPPSSTIEEKVANEQEAQSLADVVALPPTASNKTQRTQASINTTCCGWESNANTKLLSGGKLNSFQSHQHVYRYINCLKLIIICDRYLAIMTLLEEKKHAIVGTEVVIQDGVLAKCISITESSTTTMDSTELHGSPVYAWILIDVNCNHNNIFAIC